MKRAHRRAHLFLWPVLGLLLALGIALALILRPPPETQGLLTPHCCTEAQT